MVQRTLTGFIGALIAVAIFFFLPASYFSFLLSLTIFYILFFEWPTINPHVSRILRILVPVCVLISWQWMLSMNADERLRPLLILLFVGACCFDIGAYFAGTFFGKHRIAPVMSPKKTWEGLAGGYITSCLGLLTAAAIFGWQASWSMLILIAVPLCITAFLGDLFESWLKRKAHLKDSGSLLPGHGGLFDRFDSILPTAVVIYIFRDALIKNIF
jgi:CDP-diglyceride synthetase